MSLLKLQYRCTKRLHGCLVLLLCLGGWYVTFSQGSDRELLDNLYNDILGTASGAYQKNLDTGSSHLNGSEIDTSQTSQITSPASLSIEADLRLKTEIDEMVKDAQQRHEATIKFMQETR